MKSLREEKEEKRNHTRHPVTENGIVLFHKKAGLVLDMSNKGMSINLFDISGPFPDNWEVNFYCAATNTKIKALQLKLVREETEKISEIGIKTQIVGVIFFKPTPLQQKQIKRHISN